MKREGSSKHTISIIKKNMIIQLYLSITVRGSVGEAPRGASLSARRLSLVNQMLQPAWLVEVSGGAFIGLVGIELFLLFRPCGRTSELSPC